MHQSLLEVGITGAAAAARVLLYIYSTVGVTKGILLLQTDADLVVRSHLQVLLVIRRRHRHIMAWSGQTRILLRNLTTRNIYPLLVPVKLLLLVSCLDSLLIEHLDLLVLAELLHVDRATVSRVALRALLVPNFKLS